MKTERLALPYRKNLCEVHPDWRPTTSYNVAAVTAISRHLHRKETNMEKMDKLTHPIDLYDEELDLVAAAWNNCGGRAGATKGNDSINVLSFVARRLNTGILSFQSTQSATD